MLEHLFTMAGRSQLSSSIMECQRDLWVCIGAVLNSGTTLCRIPLSLGNKVSSRLLARAARAWLAPGESSPSNVTSKPINPDGTSAAASSRRSASSTTELRKSPGAVAVRDGADSPPALGGTSQTSLGGPETLEEEEEDPFIKDTEDLVNSMQASSPSWNEGIDLPADASTSYGSDSQGNDSQAKLGNLEPANDRYIGNGNRNSSSGGGGSDVMADSPAASSKEGRWTKDGSIDMVVFDKGESIQSVQQSVASSNGSSKQ